MIATLLHFLRLAFGSSGLWLDPALPPSSSFVIGSETTPGTLYIQDGARTLVTCTIKTDCSNGVCVEHFDRCEVAR
ncbi:MAG TPA: hypothetical protein VGH28_10600 [Polyangiaceae bacterium]|jgi:hypothetical protein